MPEVEDLKALLHATHWVDLAIVALVLVYVLQGMILGFLPNLLRLILLVTALGGVVIGAAPALDFFMAQNGWARHASTRLLVTLLLVLAIIAGRAVTRVALLFDMGEPSTFGRVGGACIAVVHATLMLVTCAIVAVAFVANSTIRATWENALLVPWVSQAMQATLRLLPASPAPGGLAADLAEIHYVGAQDAPQLPPGLPFLDKPAEEDAPDDDGDAPTDEFGEALRLAPGLDSVDDDPAAGQPAPGQPNSSDAPVDQPRDGRAPVTEVDVTGGDDDLGELLDEVVDRLDVLDEVVE